MFQNDLIVEDAPVVSSGAGILAQKREIRELDDVVRPGDAVLVKASRAIGLEAIAAALANVPA